MTDKPELSAFEKFQQLLGKLVQVPKDEADREARKEEALREKK